MSERNLLEETLEELTERNLSPADVRWIGSPEWGHFNWEEFARVAGVVYDASWGSAEVANDLLVVGDDWWLERGEYDGSEWWDFHTLPEKPDEHRPPQFLTGRYNASLKNLHEDDFYNPALEVAAQEEPHKEQGE